MDQKKFKQLLKLLAAGIILYCAIQKYTLIIKGLKFLLNLTFPFLLGGIIAFIIDVPMRSIERHLFPNSARFQPFRRVSAYLITLALVIGTLVFASFVVIPELGKTGMLIINQIPTAFHNFQIWLYNITEQLPNARNYVKDVNLNWQEVSTYVIKIIRTAGTKLLNSSFGIVSGIIGGVTTFVIAFTFSIYVIFQKEKLSSQIKQILYAVLSEKKAEKIIYVGSLSNKVFSSFLSGQCIEAVILGSMFFVTLSIFKLPYALLIGVVIALTALIPIFGAFIGCFIGAFLIVMVSPIQALWFIIIFFILQQIEGNLIYPHVVGGSIGLPSIWVLAAVTVGGSLMGIAGILLFIPLCSVFYTLIRNYVKGRLAQKNIASEKWSQPYVLPDSDTVTTDKKSKNKQPKSSTRKNKTKQNVSDNTDNKKS